ncbi:MAG: RidA family protein [Rhodospirillaceae bacterium]|nr:RidA family protein [Rhodospirillaceae bacterium]
MSREYRNSKGGNAYPSFTHGVRDGEYVFVSGQIAADKIGPTVKLGDIETETRAAMDLLGGVLAEFGLTYADLVKVGIFMTNLDEFDAMDAVYSTYFPSGKVPARTCVEARRILSDCRIEIDGIARAH